MPDGTRLPPKVRNGLVNLPNIITFARLCAVPLAVWLVLHHQMLPAFWLFAAAGASDAIDGWLARRQGTTALGAMMDPLADKALLVSMYVTLANIQALPDWLAIMVVFRDLVIVGGVLLLLTTGHPVAIRPLFVSKLNTALQIILVAATLLHAGLALAWDSSLGVLVAAVAVSTFISGAAYVWNAVRSR